MDYGSDTQLPEEKGDSPVSTPVCELPRREAPNPFPERGDVDALTALCTTPNLGSTIVSNPLDEEQERVVRHHQDTLRRAHQRSKAQLHSEYIFTPPTVEQRLRAVGQSLATWIIGSEVSSAEEVDKRKALDLRYLEPTVFTLDGYKARLEKQARGVPVPPIKGVPVVKTAEESNSDEDCSFIKWVHKTRRLSNIYALRNSANVADVRLERKLRYEFAKLRAKGRSRASRHSRYALATSVATSPGQTLTMEPSDHH